MIFMVMDTKNIGSDLASLQKTGCYIPWRQFSIIFGNMAQGFLERLELQIKLSTKAPGSQSHAQWIMSLMKSPWDSHTLHIGISYSYLVPCVCVRLVMSITEIFPWFPWCPLLKSTMVHGRSSCDEWHEPSPVDVHTIAGPKEGSTLRDSVQLSQHILLLLISLQRWTSLRICYCFCYGFTKHHDQDKGLLTWVTWVKSR